MTLTVARWYNGIDPEGPNCSDIDPALRALKCYIVPQPTKGKFDLPVICALNNAVLLRFVTQLWLSGGGYQNIINIRGKLTEVASLLRSLPSTIWLTMYCTKLVLNHGEYWQHQWYGRYKEIVGQCQGCRCDHINHRNSIVSCRHSSSSKGRAKAVNVMVGEYHQHNVSQLPAHMSKRVLFPMEIQDVDHRCCSHMWHTEVLSVKYV